MAINLLRVQVTEAAIAGNIITHSLAARKVLDADARHIVFNARIYRARVHAVSESVGINGSDAAPERCVARDQVSIARSTDECFSIIGRADLAGGEGGKCGDERRGENVFELHNGGLSGEVLGFAVTDRSFGKEEEEKEEVAQNS